MTPNPYRNTPTATLRADAHAYRRLLITVWGMAKLHRSGHGLAMAIDVRDEIRLMEAALAAREETHA